MDHLISLCADTKKASELMVHAYPKFYETPCTRLRFFTVFVPMGRPYMVCFKFADALHAGRTIQIYNIGDFRRDFTSSTISSSASSQSAATSTHIRRSSPCSRGMRWRSTRAAPSSSGTSATGPLSGSGTASALSTGGIVSKLVCCGAIA